MNEALSLSLVSGAVGFGLAVALQLGVALARLAREDARRRKYKKTSRVLRPGLV